MFYFFYSGECKLHETKDLYNMADFLSQSVTKSIERASAMYENCRKNVDHESEVEDRLRRHVDDISRSMEDRKNRVCGNTCICIFCYLSFGL